MALPIESRVAARPYYDLHIPDDMVALMSSPWGRRLAHWLVFGQGQLDDECFDGNVKDGICQAIHAARADGRRDSARKLRDFLRGIAPDQYREMNREHDEAEMHRQTSEGIDQ